jgi:hypothetical protein
VLLAHTLAFVGDHVRADAIDLSSGEPMSAIRHYDILAFGAHPDDLEVVMGGTTAKMVRGGHSILFVDLCDGEPTRYAGRGVRQAQAAQADAHPRRRPHHLSIFWK